MSTFQPPKTTLILYNIPDQCLLGIDLQFFTATIDFNGIKVIPDGIHVLHWSPPTPGSTSTSRITEVISTASQTNAEDENDLLNSESAVDRQLAAAGGDALMSNMNMRMARFFEASNGKVIHMQWDDEREEFSEFNGELNGRGE